LEVNAEGGLLGRPVQLVYYDDQSKPDTVPGIYAKLLDVDKVDLLMGAATNLIVAAMPEIMQRQKMVMVLVALGSNDEFKYPRYFQSAAWGPDAKGVMGNAFFEVAKTISPRPKTVAIVGADAEFSNNVMIGARAAAKRDGFDIVYDHTYPPSTVDYSPIVRAIQATNPDLVFVASYPLDSVGIVRAATELGLKTQLFGGGMVGLQYATFLQQLSDKLDRVVNYHLYVPSSTMKFPGIEEFLKTYQARAPQVGTDPLGFYQPPFAYAAMQVLEQAVKATGCNGRRRRCGPCCRQCCAGVHAGDHLVMSYPWCGSCVNCRQHLHSYCEHAFDLKMRGTRADGSTLLAKNGAPVYSAFFQQSSFGTFALTQVLRSKGAQGRAT
jgi:branched-chain amino acid transport system substrate-binding protein